MVSLNREQRGVLLLICRLLVGGIFLVAGLDKVVAPGAFAEAIRGYHLIPSAWSLPMAYVLPWVELLAAAYLILGFFSRVGAALAIAMLAVFVVALGHALVTGDTAHACGCFGQGEAPNPILSATEGGSTIGWWDVIRDVLLMGMSALVVWWGPGPWAIDALVHGRPRRELSQA